MFCFSPPILICTSCFGVCWWFSHMNDVGQYNMRKFKWQKLDASRQIHINLLGTRNISTMNMNREAPRVELNDEHKLSVKGHYLFFSICLLCNRFSNIIHLDEIKTANVGFFWQIIFMSLEVFRNRDQITNKPMRTPYKFFTKEILSLNFRTKSTHTHIKTKKKS